MAILALTVLLFVPQGGFYYFGLSLAMRLVAAQLAGTRQPEDLPLLTMSRLVGLLPPAILR